MRWILLLLMPCMATAGDLTGVWSKVEDSSNSINRAVIVDASDRIYFYYENDAGHRCEAMGIAQRRSSAAGVLYVFKNDQEHQFYQGYEGYGLEEHQDCEISFQSDGMLLKVRSAGNCRSFCGMRAAIGGDLRKVPRENLTISSDGGPDEPTP